MSGRVPPIRGRAGSRSRHPSGTPRSRATRAGSAAGKQAGHMAAGFANTAGQSYRQTRGARPSVAARVVRSKGGKYAAGGAAGAVAGAAGYGLLKAHVGRSNQSTQVNVVLGAEQPRRRGGVFRRRGRVRRDRYGRFR